jgi:hypothetical protein
MLLHESGYQGKGGHYLHVMAIPEKESGIVLLTWVLKKQVYEESLKPTGWASIFCKHPATAGSGAFPGMMSRGMGGTRQGGSRWGRTSRRRGRFGQGRIQLEE